jgi:ADA HAT complex component 1
VSFAHHIYTTTHVVKTTEPACAMQTIFRLPWSTEPSSDEALADKMYLHKSRPKPRVEIPLLNNIKRKRTDSLDVPSKNALHVKKLKCDRDGAVQPSSLPAKGVDAISDIRPHMFSDKPVKKEGTTSALACVAPHGGNVMSFAKEKGPATPGVTPASTRSASLVSTPTATATNDISGAFDSFATMDASTADPDSNLDKLRAIIEAHINLEILHKHNELRLIEQELAKCQVSLEQLRRCELMPYPGSTGPSQDVTKGTGKAIKSPAGYSEPQFPAPWGVTDGPYARHYATWLLPDPAFDPWRSHSSSHVGTPMTTRGNRGMRGSAFDFHLPAPPARTSRTSTGNRADPGTPTGRDPMIMKRQADNEWVRLRCSVCHRSNFNNIQGFLNHCRIAHHQDYKSHEAAAIACGEVVSIICLPMISIVRTGS